MCKRDGLACMRGLLAIFLLTSFLTILLTCLWTLSIPCAGRFKLRGAWSKERRMLGGPYRGLTPERDR